MEQNEPSRQRGTGALLNTHKSAVALLSVTSFVGGMVEALFLVIVTRTAFAITDGDDTVGFVAGQTASVGEVVVLALLLVMLRVALAVAAIWQSARLSTTVTARLRTELGDTFLNANWAAQHGERAGRLQELLTTFSQQGASLVESVMQGITASFSLFALLLSAVVIDPPASIALIVVVALLASALRPLRAAVRRQAMATAETGMDYATSLSEISQLGMEMHVFNVQPQTRSRVSGLIKANAKAAEKLTFLRGMVPADLHRPRLPGTCRWPRRRRSARLGQPHVRRRRDAGDAAITQLRPRSADVVADHQCDKALPRLAPR